MGRGLTVTKEMALAEAHPLAEQEPISYGVLAPVSIDVGLSVCFQLRPQESSYPPNPELKAARALHTLCAHAAHTRETCDESCDLWLKAWLDESLLGLRFSSIEDYWTFLGQCGLDSSTCAHLPGGPMSSRSFFAEPEVCAVCAVCAVAGGWRCFVWAGASRSPADLGRKRAGLFLKLSFF